ncbi:hypothetical protein OKW30_001840 [Paraburkholderia sp. Clong3]|uniref:hypothetical protein n=2 Tax=unclassified Paraburkholderia TaxID=2615204 RepID=UPI00161F1103|nr:hypothetical protein [Paraburkholderia sp. CI2]MBB5470996.1 hypothetical protein [Paraburkholderia sp. CI2]
MSPLTSSFFLGIDSGLCCLAIGMSPLAWNVRLELALMFGVCDAIASAASSLFGYPFAAPPTLAIYLCCVLVLGAAARRDRRLINALPFVLSMDNLVAGGGLYDAIADGLGSATLALLGFLAGAMIFRRVSGNWPSLMETDHADGVVPLVSMLDSADRMANAH